MRRSLVCLNSLLLVAATATVAFTVNQSNVHRPHIVVTKKYYFKVMLPQVNRDSEAILDQDVAAQCVRVYAVINN